MAWTSLSHCGVQCDSNSVDPSHCALEATAASRAPEVHCSARHPAGAQAVTFVYFSPTFTLWQDGSPPELMRKELTPQGSVGLGVGQRRPESVQPGQAPQWLSVDHWTGVTAPSYGGQVPRLQARFSTGMQEAADQ